MRKLIRPLVSSALAVSLALSSVEAVAGVVRDGEVHHETGAEALSHNAIMPLGHGHAAEKSPDASSEQDEHEHDSSSDHCTHVHGIALPAVATYLGRTIEVRVAAFHDVEIVNQTASTPIPHPPQA